MQWGDSQSGDYASQIDVALDNLSVFPLMGKQRNDYFPGCRAVTVGSHLVLYVVEQERVVVTKILHQKVDVQLQLIMGTDE
jgi:toxin ParE1/3/4